MIRFEPEPDPREPALAVVDDDYVPPEEPMDGWRSNEHPQQAVADPANAARFVDGAAFILDAPDAVPIVWGEGSDILWAAGEALMICGGSGVGKTTIAGQLVRGRLGLDTSVLGLRMEHGDRRVLYLAMDRPSQTRRALRRAFAEDEREVLAECLRFWPGPPLYDMATHTDLLLQMCQHTDADTVVIDSLKDAAIGLSADEVGAGYNRARQKAIAAGIEVLELHHLVKRNATGGAPESIADIYGAGWLTAGAGSIVLLHGQPGDPVVSLRHLKQPVDEVGPWQIQHDNRTGLSHITQAEIDPLAIVRANRDGITARGLAQALYEAHKPTPAQVEKARRRLDKLVADDLAVCLPGNRTEAARYFPVAARHLRTPPEEGTDYSEQSSTWGSTRGPRATVDTDQAGSPRTTGASRSEVHGEAHEGPRAETGSPHAPIPPPLGGGGAERGPVGSSLLDALRGTILEILTAAGGELGVRDIASLAETDIPQAERMLNALRTAKAVIRNNSGPGRPTTWSMAEEKAPDAS